MSTPFASRSARRLCAVGAALSLACGAGLMVAPAQAAPAAQANLGDTGQAIGSLGSLRIVNDMADLAGNLQIPVNDTTAAPDPIAKTDQPKDFASIERRVFDEVNEVRRQHGLRTLRWNEGMARESRAWSQHMATTNIFDHDRNQPHGENLARVSNEASAVPMWMDSPGHRANVLKPSYRYAGVGVKKTIFGQYLITMRYAS